MEFYVSGKVIKPEEESYDQRRKSQNRLAQRRHREKARLRKHVASKSSEKEITGSNAGNRQEQPDLSLEHVSPSDSDVPFVWHSLDEIPNELPLDPLDIFKNGKSQNQCSSTMRLHEHDNFIRVVPGTESSSQQVETLSGNLHCQDVDVPIASVPCLEQIRSGAILGQDNLYKDLSHGDQRTSVSDGRSSGSCSGDCEAKHEQLQHYESVLRGQRLQLYSQAEKLVEKSISLLDTGVLLGILPSNPHLRHLLASAQADIQSRGPVERQR